MDELNPEQKKQLKVWTEQRDEILREISVSGTERDVLKKSNIELTASNTEVSNKIQQGLGRLEQIKIQEEERKNLVSKDILDLEERKTILETRVSGLSGDVKDLILQKNDITTDIKNLSEVHTELFSKVSFLHEIIDLVKKTTSESVSDFNAFFVALKTSVQEIIDLNSENVKETKVVLEALPKAILQFRRPVQLIRPVLNKRRGLEELAEIDKFKGEE